MGRYYQGDIEGKFWFAIQNSDAADRFGSIGTNSYLEYYFHEDHLAGVKSEIDVIKKELGEKEELLNKLTKNGYTLQDTIDNNLTQADMENYADLQLGIKIRNCIIKTGSCAFTAEL